MILFDTNVMPEPLRHMPESRVIEWIDAPANGFAVATRDTGPFEAAGVAVINPWGQA